MAKPFSLWRRANARNVRLYYSYWQYTDLFIFRFVSLLCLRSTLRLFHYYYKGIFVKDTRLLGILFTYFLSWKRHFRFRSHFLEYTWKPKTTSCWSQLKHLATAFKLMKEKGKHNKKYQKKTTYQFINIVIKPTVESFHNIFRFLVGVI